MEHEIEYAIHEGRHIAYQVIGDGPPDLLLLDLWFTHLDNDWDDPHFSRFLRRLAASARLIRFDKSGMGLSDRVPPEADRAMEVWAAEAIAVLDAVGTDRVQLFAANWSGPLGIQIAAQHPDRVERLALASTFAKLRGGPDFPLGADPDVCDAGRQLILDKWGTGVMVDVLAQNRQELPESQQLLDARYERSTAAWNDVPAIADALLWADTRSLLGEVRADTLVLYRPNPFLAVEHAEWLKSEIHGARLEVAEDEEWHYYVAGDDFAPEMAAALEFLTDSPVERDLNRQLITMVFLDVVESTPLVSRIGDREWSDLVEQLTGAINLYLSHYRGRLINSAGDGFFTVFDSPSRAVRFAATISAKAAELGIPIRTGVHTGECQVKEDELLGLAVHVAARIMSLADPDEILVSGVVRQLVDTDGFGFTDRGTQELRGVPGCWDVYAIES